MRRKKNHNKKAAQDSTTVVREETIGTAAAVSTGVLRAVPQRSVSKKFIFLVFFAILAVFIFIKSQKHQSEIKISQNKNNFRIDFQINKKDQRYAQEILQKIQANQDIQKGVEFQLDATSSAKLAFAAPITIKTKFQKDAITFQGESQIPIISGNLTSPSGFGLPQDTNMVIYQKDLVQNLASKLQLQKTLADYLSQNFKSQDGQMLIFYGEKNDFILVVKPIQIPDLHELETILKSSYKKETEGEVDIHILKISDEQSLSFFQLNDHLYMTSTLDGAKNMIKIQNSQAASLKFPPINSNISFAFFVHEGELTNEQAFAYITNLSPTVQKYAKGAKEGLLVIRDKQISGYINF